MELFKSDINFCSLCGAILPHLGPKGGLKCKVCNTEVDIRALDDVEIRYKIHFNSLETYLDARKANANAGETEGPLVERRCPKCGHEGMTYATLQLRSADEGQTVFYTCPGCKFKETENS